MSSHRSIRAAGIAEHIDTPAIGGAQRDSPFQQRITRALQRARQQGIEAPIMIGAIPFDVTQPSCLYIPEQYEFFDRASVSDQPRKTHRSGSVLGMRSIPDERRFKAGVSQAIANFRHSEIKKAVLSRIFEIQLDQVVNIDHIFDMLFQQNPSGYQFSLALQDDLHLIGVSPELLIRKQGSLIQSNPLAGSAKRQAHLAQDHSVSEALKASSKDNHEHALVIDEIRRVLTPHCRILDIPLEPSLFSTAAMWHLSTAISGELWHVDRSALQLACQLHPTPAVCGFPTDLSRKLIHLIEPFERGLFTGMVGWCDAAGDGEWVVTIRCGTVQNSRVRLFAGAGVVESSCPESEWAETQAKLATMLNAFGIAPEVVSQ